MASASASSTLTATCGHRVCQDSTLLSRFARCYDSLSGSKRREFRSNLANAGLDTEAGGDKLPFPGFATDSTTLGMRKIHGELGRVLDLFPPATAKAPPPPLASDMGSCLGDSNVDLTGWHMELIVNKLQGRLYCRQRLVITPHVIAMGGLPADTAPCCCNIAEQMMMMF